ncbi:type II toxin-antitoxin system VapC family toxin [Kamptonema cortianum]|nr:type II toxin-antitoxin system VapC family toxin [Oscillatoria laete-virens]MDK3159960.1 type II toxin-antitoxin system VapC family toxin [Kamptonema cortianum]MDL5047199.1 type II toxin-antitoxin system VapC family toxin [Oscillatoria amoena NRMC-F 0135]MDL5055469.1 type II toxin-antitoxin system VapC family toxin [Oscillatoria laete-virens NRMC-F 0139]
MYLLDSCTLLWLGLKQESLSEQAKTVIDAHQHSLSLATVSAFEIVRKHSLGKLELPVEPMEWVEGICEFYGVRTLPMTLTIAMRAALLPPIHKDTCDRIIIATAIESNLKILSPDPIMPKYGVKMVW